MTTQPAPAAAPDNIESCQFEMTFRDSTQGGTIVVRSIALGITPVVLIERDVESSDPAAGLMAFRVDSTNLDVRGLQYLAQQLDAVCQDIIDGDLVEERGPERWLT